MGILDKYQLTLLLYLLPSLFVAIGISLYSGSYLLGYLVFLFNIWMSYLAVGVKRIGDIVEDIKQQGGDF